MFYKDFEMKRVVCTYDTTNFILRLTPKAAAYSQHFLSFVTYEWAHKKAGVLHYTRPERLLGTNAPAYWSHSYVAKKMEYC
jgi:hypothetical protein